MATKSRALEIGIFVVIGLLILSAGVFLIGNREFMFSDTYTLKASFPNVSGLTEGADVRVGGTRQGVVHRIDLPIPPDRKITVVMSMQGTTRRILRTTSVASIKTEGILGNKYVEISFGSGGAEVKGGDVIHAEPAVDAAELAYSVAMQTKRAIASFEDTMDALKHNFLLRGYFNRRGYQDEADLTRHAIRKLPSGAPAKVFTYDADDLFGKDDSARLKHEKALNDVGKFLESSAFYLAVIRASGGSLGDSDKQLTLTRAQAENVRDYLVQSFAVDDARLKTQGLGKNKKAGMPATIEIAIYPQRHAKNR